MFMSPDIIEYLSNQHTQIEQVWKTVPRSVLDDELLSCFVFRGGSRITQNLKRIDILDTDTLLYHKCHPDNQDIYCFRFKSSNRKEDVERMKIVARYLMNRQQLLFLKQPSVVIESHDYPNCILKIQR